MPGDETSTRVAILSYGAAQQAAVFGLSDLFSAANRFQEERGKPDPVFEVDVLRRPPADDQPVYGFVILPPALSGPPKGAELACVARWLPEQHRAGAVVCSVCAGSFLLAASGLLARRAATTHWALATDFASQFPDVRLEAEKLLIDDGDIITAGGVMAWVDLGLRLIDRVMGPSVMLATARFFLVDPGGREQRFYSSFSPRLTHGDAAILMAQHWVQESYSSRVTVAGMAAKAGLEKRTFSRRFLAATGLNASDYLQHLRVGKAREMMELTSDTVDTIAFKVGYEDASAFRKVFFKLIGLTPRDYRKRFGALPAPGVED